MASRSRLTEEFVKHLNRLTSATHDDPHETKQALTRDPSLGDSIKTLHAIWWHLEEHRKHSNNRFIYQAHPRFAAARKDYADKWESAFFEWMQWDDERCGRPQLDLTEFEPSTETDGQQEEDWDFDPDQGNAGEFMERLCDYAQDRSDDAPFFSQAAGAAQWFRETVGLQFPNMEARFKELGVFVVPSHVSDAHSIRGTKSLYNYLSDWAKRM